MADEDRRTVLVVDDDEIKRYTVTRILSKAGFTTTSAATGAETLEAVRANPDLVILDVNLPDINGFDICRRLKSDPATSSIIVLHFSATMTDSDDRAVGLEGGADGYLTEPVSPAELVATVRSMLRIREAERTARALATQWQATFDAISDGVCLLDERDRTVRCNAAMAAFAGRSPADLVGLTCSELTGLPAGEAPCARARETRQRVAREDERDGRWLSTVADPVVDERGVVTGTVYIVSDVTEVKRREAERTDLLEREKSARGLAETANRAKDEFLATISHELRTPLNSMLGWISLLRQGSLDEPETARALEVLERNARSQAQLISDILDVSRIITGKVRLDVREVDVASIVAATVDSVRPGADAKGVAVATTFEQDTAVTADPERLQQVAWNLLSNAVKFTPKGGRIDVAVRRVGSNVELFVADTGAGIDAAFLPYVFDRFRQADSSTTRVHSGLGLGLSIVRHLVELHGGTATANSPGRGAGSTFTVALPARVVTEAFLAPPPGAAENRGATALTALNGLRVLVLDDDADTRAMLATVLEQCGAAVCSVATAQDAIRAVREWKPDVIVSDIGLPGTDGHTFIRRVRGLPPEGGGRVPAVALTAYARTEDRLRALASGFQMYVSKPAEPAELTAVVAILAGRLV